MSSWMPDTSYVHPGSMLVPILFNIFISDLDNALPAALHMIKLGRVVNTPDGCAAI